MVLDTAISSRRSRAVGCRRAMMEDPRTISSAIDLVFVAKAIERVGDHAKNLAEQIIYIVKGTDVRHSPVDAVESLVR
jgi:phosphate transport system protein